MPIQFQPAESGIAKKRGGFMMKKWALVGLFIGTLLLSGCVQSINTTSNSQPKIVMSASQFTSLTKWVIKAGDSVHFYSGGVHNLVTGEDGNYIAQPGAPDDFNNPNGFTFNPGDDKLFKFPTTGTYTITCSIHDAMLLTIVVEP